MSSQSRIKITLALTKSFFFATNILLFWVIFWEDYVTVLGSKGVLRDECLNSSVCFTGSVRPNHPKTLWRRYLSPLTREHWGSKRAGNQLLQPVSYRARIWLCLPGSKTRAHFILLYSFFNGNKYLHLNLFHVVTRNQMFNPCKVQIHLMFYFSSRESEICFGIASFFGSNGGKELDNSDNDKDKGR